MKHERLEEYLNILKGSFTPEQFGVFLNMYSCEIEDNYLVLAHETFHHWQSIFTPYGQLKWGCTRSFSSDVVDLWIQATNDCKSGRPIPAAEIIPCQTMNQAKCLSEILLEEVAWQLFTLEEKAFENTQIEEFLPITMDEICPSVSVEGKTYRLNGIDILESWAKYYEYLLSYFVNEKEFDEVINPTVLNTEYYSALFYFIEKVGFQRIGEFSVACELSLYTGKICRYDNNTWKQYHPAWRFVKIIDEMSKLNPSDYLTLDNTKDYYLKYSEMILQKCGFTNRQESWEGAIEYIKQADLSISNDMKKAIEFLNNYPWALSFPLIDFNVFLELKRFTPYYITTADNANYLINSKSLANEVVFENHFMAFFHQICGHISVRCLDTGKLQCGFSYYGLNVCPSFIDGTCDGHIDRYSTLPEMKLDKYSNIKAGCMFAIMLDLLGISYRDIIIPNVVNKELTKEDLSKDIKRLQSIT